MSKILTRFSACRNLKRKSASSLSFASSSSVIWMREVFWCMMAVISNIMEVLEVGHGCFVSRVVGSGVRVQWG